MIIIPDLGMKIPNSRIKITDLGIKKSDSRDKNLEYGDEYPEFREDVSLILIFRFCFRNFDPQIRLEP